MLYCPIDKDEKFRCDVVILCIFHLKPLFEILLFFNVSLPSFRYCTVFLKLFLVPNHNQRNHHGKIIFWGEGKKNIPLVGYALKISERYRASFSVLFVFVPLFWVHVFFFFLIFIVLFPRSFVYTFATRIVVWLVLIIHVYTYRYYTNEMYFPAK